MVIVGTNGTDGTDRGRGVKWASGHLGPALLEFILLYSKMLLRLIGFGIPVKS